MSAINPSSQTTLGILLGAKEWAASTLSTSSAFARSASRVSEYFLYSGQFGFRRENWLDLFDRKQSSPYEVDQAISTFLQDRISMMKEEGTPASDLLFYYIGHGMFALGPDQAYHLAIRSTKTGSIRSSAIAMAALAETLKTNARHLRRFVILDCCFAAESCKYMMQAEIDQTALKQTISAFEEKSTAIGFPRKGTALLCSSGQKEASLILPDESGTMFSEALVRALEQGNTRQQEKAYLSLYDLKTVIEEVLENLGEENAPRPFVSSPDQSDGDVAAVPFFPNPQAEDERRRKAEKERVHALLEEQARQAAEQKSAEETRVFLAPADAPALVSPTKVLSHPAAPLETYQKRSLRISRRTILIGLGVAVASASSVLVWFSSPHPPKAVGKWREAGPCPLKRSSFRATKLQNGLILVEGGFTANTVTNTSALFDSKRGVWTATGNLNMGRYEHSATLLNNGRVLVAGGFTGNHFLNSAETYDPTSGTWTSINSMKTARTRHTATLLANGKVLVTGGWHEPDRAGLNMAELYNPDSKQWSSAGSMIYPRINHAAVQIPDGRVLLIGGDNHILETEFYDPDTNSWRLTKGKLNMSRADCTAVLLPGGQKVLVVGGRSDNDERATPTAELGTNTAEVFDIATERWKLVKSMQYGRVGAPGWEASVLSNGTVLVAGGDVHGTSEIYDPEHDTWSSPVSIEQSPLPRYEPATTLLPDGKVLIAGGKWYNLKGDVILLASCAIYTP